MIYKAFGLRLSSEIPLPELPQWREQDDQSDIVIERADLHKIWQQLATQNENYVIENNQVMFQIPNTAIFSIQAGNRIIVSPMKGSDEDKIRLYILGTCMGALLMQRRILPLHGSAVAIDGKAYAFVGDSGAGKSTLASAFLAKGYQLLSDDVIAVSLSHDHIPLVTPAYPQQKLWQETLTQFGMETTHYRPIFQRETKYAVPVASKFSAEPLPLAGVFELVKTENETIEIYPFQRLQRLHILFYHTYRNFLLKRLGLMEWHFKTTASIVNQLELYQIHRPISVFTAPQLASLILRTLHKEE